MRASIRKMGNSSGVIIPKPILGQIGVTAGDEVELTLAEGRIVLEPVRKGVREGWSEEAKAIAEAGEDELLWPEFGNVDDDLLEW